MGIDNQTLKKKSSQYINQWRSGGIGRHAGLSASENAKSNPVGSNARDGSSPSCATKLNFKLMKSWKKSTRKNLKNLNY